MNVSTILSCQSRLRPVTREPSDVDSTGPVAQWSELAAHNRLVGGSSPPGPTNIIQWLMELRSITSSIFKLQNGNGHGNILQSWAVLTNSSRVAFRDETSTAAILLSR